MPLTALNKQAYAFVACPGRADTHPVAHHVACWQRRLAAPVATFKLTTGIFLFKDDFEESSPAGFRVVPMLDKTRSGLGQD